MLYTGYLIILDGQSIKKIGFGNFHFSAAEAGKLHKQVVPPTPWENPLGNMLYIAYFISVSGHNIKKMFCKIFHF